MDIGWIGLGKMGVPMSQQLLKAGHSLAVYNRTTEKEKPLILIKLFIIIRPDSGYYTLCKEKL